MNERANRSVLSAVRRVRATNKTAGAPDGWPFALNPQRFDDPWPGLSSLDLEPAVEHSRGEDAVRSKINRVLRDAETYVAEIEVTVHRLRLDAMARVAAARNEAERIRAEADYRQATHRDAITG